MTQVVDQFTSGFGSEKFGSDFFTGARPSPENLVSRLVSGTSVAVLGHRKIGKTSLLAETRERLRSIGKKVVWIDFDIEDTPTKALIGIISSIRYGGNKRIVDGLNDWAGKSELIPAELKTTVRALVSGTIDSSSLSFDEKHFEVLFRQVGRLLEMQALEDKPIIMLNELTTLIMNTIDSAKPEEYRRVVGVLNSLLGQFRYWRKANVGICMAVSGSESLNWLKRKYGIRSDSLNDCVRIDIEELDRAATRKLISMCVDAKTLPNWSEQLTEELLDFLPAYYPGVIQLAFDVVSSESNSNSPLNDSIRRKIYKALRVHYLEQFTACFQRYGNSERQCILKLLDALENNDGEKINTNDALEILYNVNLAMDEIECVELLEQLSADSFIEIIPGGVCLATGLVKAWRNCRN